MRAGMAAAFLILQCTGVFAFEIDGFKSGMPEAEALSVLAKYGDYVKQSGANSDNNVYISKPPSAFRVLQICSGRLATYQVEIPGGWHAFMRTLERSSRDFGAGTYGLSSNETSYGPSNSLSFEWKMQNSESLLISFGQVGEQEPTAYRFLRSPNKCGD